jgi:hypothetical protein
VRLPKGGSGVKGANLDNRTARRLSFTRRLAGFFDMPFKTRIKACWLFTMLVPAALRNVLKRHIGRFGEENPKIQKKTKSCRRRGF